MIRARAAALACTLLLPALGCGSTPMNENPYPTPGTGGALGHMPSGTVVISIESPTDGMSFGAGTLVPIQARVRVEDGSDFIDTASVGAYITRESGTTMAETGKLVPADGDLDTGRISLAADLPTGTYTLWVTATTSGGGTGKQSVNFTVDSGPSITITAPVEGGSYRTGLVVEVKVSGLDPANPPTATVGPLNVALTAVDDPATTYRGQVTFDYDPNRLPLTGPQLLTVTATSAGGKRVEEQLIFIVDNTGPVITATTPAPGQMVGGITNISALVQDSAGILDSSVVAIIGDDTERRCSSCRSSRAAPAVYGVLFDTVRLTGCKPIRRRPDLCIVFPTISFRASDQVGNETVLGYDFSVDNIAPVADLDPPDVRDTQARRRAALLARLRSAGRRHLAGDMPNDGKVVPQVFDLRARVAGRRQPRRRPQARSRSRWSIPTTPSVYILDDTSQPLVVDTDGDGTCDAINPLAHPHHAAADPEQPGAQGPAGPVPRSRARADFTAAIPTLPATRPASRGSTPSRRSPSADGDQPTIAITYAFGQPAIWSVEPINAAFGATATSSTRSRTTSARGGPASPSEPGTTPATTASRPRCGSTSTTTSGTARPPTPSGRHRRPGQGRRPAARGTSTQRRGDRPAPTAPLRRPAADSARGESIATAATAT